MKPERHNALRIDRSQWSTLNHNTEKTKFIEKRIISIARIIVVKQWGRGQVYVLKRTYFMFSSEYKDCMVVRFVGEGVLT